ncbi:MAG: hypothetical protein ABNH27_08625 [Alcanivorax sp.]|uniref:hypothetical protein n=1 Tax=Alcanivorax borkumensis TaxID=59754 RepID=UPI0032DDC4DC
MLENPSQIGGDHGDDGPVKILCKLYGGGHAGLLVIKSGQEIAATNPSTRASDVEITVTDRGHRHRAQPQENTMTEQIQPNLALYNKFSALPMGKALFSKSLCLKAPYFASINR